MHELTTFGLPIPTVVLCSDFVMPVHQLTTFGLPIPNVAPWPD